MKTKEELIKISQDIRTKCDLSKEEQEVLMLSANYSVVYNMLYDMDEELRYLIYKDLKEEFEDGI